jgi:hypothetical protein
MTDKDYFERHIPHRVNLLVTFRERYQPSPLRSGFDPERARDLFRCSKDMAMLMVRFFLTEMGVRLPRKKLNSPDDVDAVVGWNSRFGIKQLTVAEVKSEKRFSSIFEVLKAANRAVAHLEEADVDHPITTDSDLSLIFDAIDFTEEKIREKIYHASVGFSFETVMALPDNDMKRREG